MSSHSAASFYLAGMLALGVWIGARLRPELLLCITLTAFLLICVACTLCNILRKGFWILAGLAAAGIGMWSMAAALPENQPNHYLNHIHPEVESFEIRVLESLKSTSFSDKYIGEIEKVNRLKTGGKVLVEMRRDSARGPVLPGHLILTPVFPQPVPPPKNPGGFDYGKYLRTQGIYTRVKLNSSTCLLTPPAPVGQPVLDLRRNLHRALNDLGLGEQETQIARALLLGDRRTIGPELQQAFTRAGILHILAISGLHVGILAAFLFAFLAPLRHLPCGKGLQTVVGLTILWGYAVVAGFSPSVVRAVLLYSFVALAIYLERPGQTLHFLGLCWVFMLAAIDPNWLLQVGFQLSFAAVGAIVVFYPILIKYLTFDKWIGNSLGKLIAVSLAAQAGTLPFTLYYFHQFPGLFLLSNLVLLPGLGVLLVTGLACMSVELLIEVPRAVANLLDGLLGGMNRYVHWAAGQEIFFLKGISMSQVECILSVLAIFLSGIYLKTRRYQVLYGIALLLLLFQGTGVYQNAKGFKKQSWVIPHQIAHTMVWTRKGSRLEVAATNSDKGANLVRDAQNHWGIRHTEYSPATPIYTLGNSTLRVLDGSGLYSPGEPHPDYLLLSGSPRVHLGRVLKALKPAVVIADGSNYTNDVKRWEKSCDEKGIPFHATAFDGAYEIEVPRE